MGSTPKNDLCNMHGGSCYEANQIFMCDETEDESPFKASIGHAYAITMHAQIHSIGQFDPPIQMSDRKKMCGEC